MKKYLGLIAALVMLFNVLPKAANAETVKMAVFLLEPFMMYGPDGEVTGVAVEYWRRYIAPRMGVELEVVGLFPIMRALSLLESGAVDIIPNMTKIPEREAKFLFPDTMLAKIDSCLMVNNDSTLFAVDSQEALFDLRIGFLEAAYVPPLFVHDRIHFELVQNEDYRQLNLNKLWAGRLDAILDINYISLTYYLKQKGYENKVRILPLPVEAVPVFTLFRNTEKGRALCERYDKINTQGLAEGAFEQILDSFFDVNGD